MADIKPIETYYNGYRFRSRLEARWAVFFDAFGVEYEYEPEGLIVANDEYYLPDFYLPYFKSYFEVKRAPQKIDRSRLPLEEGYDSAIRKIRWGSYTDSWAGIIAFGDPYDHYMWIFCQDIGESSAGTYDAPVVFGKHPDTGEPVLVSWNDPGDRYFINSFDHHEIIPMTTDYEYHSLNCAKGNIYISDDVIKAELAARQARFEHGETPTV